MIKQVYCLVGLGLVGALLLSTAIITPTASASDYIFRQQIVEPVYVSVDQVVWTNNRPLITGFYDTTNKGLRVCFAGVWYIYEQDSELTVVDSTWTLDLTGLVTPFTPGDYIVIAEITNAKDVIHAVEYITRLPAKPDSSSYVPVKPKPTDKSLISTGQSLIPILLSVSLLTLLGGRRLTKWRKTMARKT